MNEPRTAHQNAPITLPGTFVWHEINTPDIAASRTFYTELFGWDVNVADMGDAGLYTTFVQNETAIAGLTQARGDAGTPAAWISYTAVTDLDAAVQQDDIHIHVPPTPIPDGHFALIADPTGAVIGLFQDQPEAPIPNGAPVVGTVCWHELLTPHPSRAAGFYGPLLGWTTRTVDMGADGTYWLFRQGERDAAGMMEMPDTPAGWLCYIAVADADATVDRAVTLGGRIRVAPRDIPDVGRFAILEDPAGAMVAVLAF
ncbi:MAG: VOC family protein [Bacteroidetes bacterium]|nr:MAG: VOC family protein [Bacteroidota bacterium]